MRPLAFTYPYVLVFVATMLWSFVLEQRIVNRAIRASANGDAPADRGSLYAIMGLQGAGFFFAFLLPWMGPRWAHFPNERLAFWTGVALMIAGSALRRMCFRALGESFTGEVRVRSGQCVVTSGPYRWIRHPAYTAGILMT